jgi:hypothetical protein
LGPILVRHHAPPLFSLYGMGGNATRLMRRGKFELKGPLHQLYGLVAF